MGVSTLTYYLTKFDVIGLMVMQVASVGEYLSSSSSFKNIDKHIVIILVFSIALWANLWNTHVRAETTIVHLRQLFGVEDPLGLHPTL